MGNWTRIRVARFLACSTFDHIANLCSRMMGRFQDVPVISQLNLLLLFQLFLVYLFCLFNLFLLYPSIIQEGQLRGDEPLYDPEILKRLDFSRCSAKFKPRISARDPGEGLLVRPLCPDDYDRGRYLPCITYLGTILLPEHIIAVGHDIT